MIKTILKFCAEHLRAHRLKTRKIRPSDIASWLINHGWMPYERDRLQWGIEWRKGAKAVLLYDDLAPYGNSPNLVAHIASYENMTEEQLKARIRFASWINEVL